MGWGIRRRCRRGRAGRTDFGNDQLRSALGACSLLPGGGIGHANARCAIGTIELNRHGSLRTCSGLGKCFAGVITIITTPEPVNQDLPRRVFSMRRPLGPLTASGTARLRFSGSPAREPPGRSLESCCDRLSRSIFWEKLSKDETIGISHDDPRSPRPSSMPTTILFLRIG